MNADSIQKKRLSGYSGNNADSSKARIVAGLLPEIVPGTVLFGKEGAVQESDAQVQMAPGAKGSKPKLKFSTLTGPTAGDCGQFSWTIRWGLSTAANATNGGWIVQKIDLSAGGKKEDGSKLTLADTPLDPSKFPYWEAWRISPGKTVTDYNTLGYPYDDGYSASGPDKTKGHITAKGDAEFYDDLAALPADFKTNNADTYAGILHATKTKPSLKGGTGRIDHNLKSEWDCLPASKNRTSTITVTPDP